MTRHARNAALTAVVISVLGGMMIDELATERATTPPRVVLVYALVMSVAAIGGWCWWQGKWWRATMSKNSAPTRVVAMVVAGVLTIRFAEWSWLASKAQGAMEAPATVAGMWSALLLLCVLRPLAEEALLRGYLLRRLRAAGSEREAVLTIAVLSALIAGSLAHAVSNAALAAMLALVVLRTGRLWLAAIAHVSIAVLGEVMRRQLGFANVPIALAVTAMTLVAVRAVVVLIRVLCETQWVEPSHSHGGMASSWRV